MQLFDIPDVNNSELPFNLSSLSIPMLCSTCCVTAEVFIKEMTERLYCPIYALVSIREIGPNASLILQDRAYSGSGLNLHNLMDALYNGDINSKFRLLANPEFLRMLETEWESSRNRFAMAGRLRRYLPSLSNSYIGERGLGGIRGSVVDLNGFVPEALEFRTEHTMHIVNYNSPGATGSPYVAYSILDRIFRNGYLWKKTVKPLNLTPVRWEELASGIGE
jgi:hypothetical protein